MAEFLFELFSEEIPARMQANAATELAKQMQEILRPLNPQEIITYYTPRRIAITAQIDRAVPQTMLRERGPKRGAPEAALAGFLRKHGAEKSDLIEDDDYWRLEKQIPARDAADLLAEALPALIWRFPWPKSMRWNESALLWVRPLRRILCLLDGDVVPFALARGDDAAHGLRSGAETEGHRFLAPGAFTVGSMHGWKAGLQDRKVVLDAAQRRAVIEAGVKDAASSLGFTVVDDPGLLDEVTGLVEWPVPLLGRIDAAFMDLPPEVMQVSMRVNQRYFALRNADGAAAPYFAFIANIEAQDCGKAIIAGNERVLRARFSDARHFWDLDRKQKLADRVAALAGVTFHAKLGSQGERASRIAALSGVVAGMLNSNASLAERAGRLAKADLTTGMVGEFPELQGVMGGYYAAHDGEDAAVVEAIRDHYLPKGPQDRVPTAPTAIAVAIADKIDLLIAMFSVGEKPTGSGDPFALRRAALGIIRIIRENQLRLRLGTLMERAGSEMGAGVSLQTDIMDFLIERLRVQLRAEGARHDVLSAVFKIAGCDDIVLLLSWTDAVAGLLAGPDGANLLAADRRAANILKIEEARDKMRYDQAPDPAAMVADEERALAQALETVRAQIDYLIGQEEFTSAMELMATLRAPLDAFFERVTVNDADPVLRRNRLFLLNDARSLFRRAADFSLIES